MKNKVKKVRKIEPVRQRVILELQPKKRVCAYARVSTDSIDQQGSFHAQVEYYKGFIGKRDDWEYVGIYSDEAKSGTQIKRRDEFTQMIKDCEAGKIDMIITKSVTRFARNTVDSIEVIRKLKLLGIGVYFEKENINTLSEKSEMLLTILSSLAQGESESISTNIKWAFRDQFAKGTFKISTPAYGYINDEYGELIIKVDEAKVVRRIFKEYLNGKGSYLIAKGLNHDNIPTIRSANEWTDTAVKDILQNPIYEGNLLLQKTYTTEVLPFQRKRNQGEKARYFIEDNHEPIITKEEAKLVGEIFEYRRNQIGIDDSGKNLNKYEFSSNIICSECGGTFRRQKIYIGKSYETVQWSCIQHIRDVSKCSMKAIKEDVIREAFITMWNKLISNYKEILVPLLESLRNLRIDEVQEDEIKDLNNRIMELTEQGLVLSRVVSKGYIDPAIFIERQNALNIEITATKKKRNQMLDNNGFEKEIEGTLMILDIIENNPEIIEDYNENLFIHIVDKIIIGKNKEITFRLINTLELTEYVGK
ncbi:recombinase family protein [Tissierella creatinophila]|uniref:Transposon gamma-delta resolvase n=1 Tax=Tissierella creatinophila DSM 6911 TaxID=1123403 RepID=A0A1U7M3W9_TISCR|nr:recombinase family protein [Tissierella creatinophila]OLS01940.1 transposon gamma-delta resolvase [Tissierella creatinophila DSM 6911]